MMIIRRSEISFVEVGHVEFLYHGVGGEVDHVDPDALPAAVGSQPLQVGAVGSLP